MPWSSWDSFRETRISAFSAPEDHYLPEYPQPVYYSITLFRKSVGDSPKVRLKALEKAY